MVFQLRVRGRSSMQRLLFSSSSCTVRDLMLQVKDLFKVNEEEQLLSKTPLAAPELINTSSPLLTLSQLNLTNGDILYLGGEADHAAPSAASGDKKEASKPASRLTARCQHGPNGACPNCLPLPSSSSSLPLPACTHGPHATCLNCSQHVKLKSEQLATWLCNHPTSVFCPKCLPPEDPTAPKPRQCDCDHSKGHECVKCVAQAPTIKVDKLPYARFTEEKKALCKFKHAASMSCAFCLPDPFPSFAGKANCDRGHAPWPHGVCLACAPANANLRVQPYRHTDSVSMEARVIQGFYTNALRKPNVQRACILFGRFAPEPEETKNPGAIRALVDAVYEPPQEFTETSGIRFLKDDRERSVHEVAQRLGLEAVGWALTAPKRTGDKYGGAVLLSGAEVQQAARFQARYKNAEGFSRFVTVVLEHQKEVEPRAYQVADMAVALEREAAFAQCSDINMLATRKPNKGEMVPTVVYKDRPLQPGEEFLPDELLVKVNLFAPKQATPMFAHNEVPSNAGDTYIHTYLANYKTNKWEDKLSDFNLLVALHRLAANTPMIFEICDAIREKKPIKPELKSVIEKEFAQMKLI